MTTIYAIFFCAAVLANGAENCVPDLPEAMLNAPRGSDLAYCLDYAARANADYVRKRPRNSYHAHFRCGELQVPAWQAVTTAKP